MKKILLSAMVLSGLYLSGCTVVTSSMPGSTAVTGEVWYTKRGGVGDRIFYCDGKSNVCQEATIR